MIRGTCKDACPDCIGCKYIKLDGDLGMSEKLAGACGDCFLYSERKKICPHDGKYRTKVNGCFINFVPKGKTNGND